MKHLLYISAVIVLLSSCGTANSLETTNYVPYAEVTVNDSLIVTGRLIDESDSTVTMSVEGSKVLYNLDNITQYERVMRPDPLLLQQDIVRNTKSTAGSTGFFVILTVISIGAFAILSTLPQ